MSRLVTCCEKDGERVPALDNRETSALSEPDYSIRLGVLPSTAATHGERAAARTKDGRLCKISRMDRAVSDADRQEKLAGGYLHRLDLLRWSFSLPN